MTHTAGRTGATMEPTMARTNKPTATRRKPGPQERARAKSEQVQHEQHARDMAIRMANEAAHHALENDQAVRVRDAVTEALLAAAENLLKQATERRTAYLLAGCHPADIPSSVSVQTRAAKELQDLAKHHAGHPIPAVMTNAQA